MPTTQRSSLDEEPPSTHPPMSASIVGWLHPNPHTMTRVNDRALSFRARDGPPEFRPIEFTIRGQIASDISPHPHPSQYWSRCPSASPIARCHPRLRNVFSTPLRRGCSSFGGRIRSPMIARMFSVLQLRRCRCAAVLRVWAPFQTEKATPTPKKPIESAVRNGGHFNCRSGEL